MKVRSWAEREVREPECREEERKLRKVMGPGVLL